MYLQVKCQDFFFFLHLSHVEFIYRTILKFIKNLCNENNDLY